MNPPKAALVAGSRDRWPLAGDQLYVDLDLSPANLPAGITPVGSEAVLNVRGPGFSDRYVGESAAVVIARRAYSFGLRPSRAR